MNLVRDESFLDLEPETWTLSLPCPLASLCHLGSPCSCPVTPPAHPSCNSRPQRLRAYACQGRVLTIYMHCHIYSTVTLCGECDFTAEETEVQRGCHLPTESQLVSDWAGIRTHERQGRNHCVTSPGIAPSSGLHSSVLSIGVNTDFKEFLLETDKIKNCV